MLGHHTPPLDVVEMYTWSLHPQWGYFKHPPLPAWFIAASVWLFGQNSFALFFPAVLSVLVSVLVVWPIARKVLGVQRAVIASGLQLTLLFCNLYSPDFNHNVVQMPVWALTIACFYWAVSTSKLAWWMAFGASLALTTLAKYSAAFLPVACVFFLVFNAQARRSLSFISVFAAALSFFLVLMPHLIWLVESDFQPFRFMQKRFSVLTGHASWGQALLAYVGLQIAVHLIALLTLAILRFRFNERDQMVEAGSPWFVNDFDRKFIWILGMGPFFITVLLAFAGKHLHPMWASAMFPLSGILVTMLLGGAARVLWSRKALITWCFVSVFLGAMYAAKNTEQWHELTHKYARASYPGPELAKLVDAKWREAVPDQPLSYLAGSAWEIGVVSLDSVYHPDVLIEGDYSTSPWIDRQKMQACGAMLLWSDEGDVADHIYENWPQARQYQTLTVLASRANTFGPVSLHYLILPPTATCRK